MFQRDLGLTDLIPLEEWQKIQDSFSDTLEVTIRTISPDGTPLSRGSRPSRFSSAIIAKTPLSSDFNDLCLSKELLASVEAHTATDAEFKYPFGLDVFTVPIKAVGNRIVAYVVLGPLIIKKRKGASEYAKEAINKYGPGKGIYLSIRRIWHCHPWATPQIDNVP